MKAFKFTLEAVRTLRLRQENEALEQYSRALAVRQQTLDALQAARDAIHALWGDMRGQLAGPCTGSQMTQLQDRQKFLERRQIECVAALRAAERGVNAASQTMLLARRQREIVDKYREKQLTRRHRMEAREEQKFIDEFAARRSTFQLNLLAP